MNIIVTIDEKYVIKYPVSGTTSYDEMVAAYRDNLLTWGILPKRVLRGDGGANLKADLNGNNIPFELTHFLMVMGLDNGNVENYNPYIKVSEADIDNEVPLGLLNRIDISYDYTDPENPVEIQTVRTWRTWRDDNHPLSEPIDGYYYFQSNTFFNYLTSFELMIIYNNLDAELVDEIPTR
ncbi:MAG: hypothetical protein FK734_05450 [Asgard group archaeon]|nr:hypothetical protein [Asgard group archaeon]